MSKQDPTPTPSVLQQFLTWGCGVGSQVFAGGWNTASGIEESWALALLFTPGGLRRPLPADLSQEFLAL